MKQRMIIFFLILMLGVLPAKEIFAAEQAEVLQMESEEFEALNDPLYARYMYGTSLMSEVSSINDITHNPKFDNYLKIKGLDVSKWQPEVDWQAVKRDGVEFAIIRLGYRGMSEGTLQLDPCFTKHVEGAYNAGLSTGVYFFTQALTVEEAKEEARYVVEQLKPYKKYISCPVMIDIEDLSGSRMNAAGLSVSEKTAICEAFCKVVEDAGYTAGIYANKYYYEEELNTEKLNNYYIWLAHYINQTTYNDKYNMWQFTDSGSVNGISGRVDLDVAYVPKSLKKVQGLEMESNKAESITLSWKRVENADGYQIVKYNTDKKKYEVVGTTQKTTYKVSNLKSGTNYLFKVRAFVNLADVKGKYSDVLSVYTRPESVTGLEISKKEKNSISLEWTKQSQATGYRVYCYDKSGKKIGTKTVKKNNLQYTGLDAGTVYQFKVRSYVEIDGQRIWSGYSSPVKARTSSETVKNLKVSSASTNKIVVEWSKVTGVKGYQVCLYNESTKEYTILGTTTKTAYSIKNLKAGKQYSIRVAPYVEENGKKVIGKYCTSLKAATKPEAVTGVKQTARTTKSITISWNGIKGVTGYRVYCYNLDGEKIKHITTTDTKCEVTGVATGKYIYKVRAYVKAEDYTAWGAYSDKLEVCTKLPRVKGVALKSASKNTIAVKWNDVKYADGYQVYLYDKKSQKYTMIGRTSKCAYTIKELKSNTKYEIRVAAYMNCNGKKIRGVSSETIIVKTK